MDGRGAKLTPAHCSSARVAAGKSIWHHWQQSADTRRPRDLACLGHLHRCNKKCFDVGIQFNRYNLNIHARVAFVKQINPRENAETESRKKQGTFCCRATSMNLRLARSLACLHAYRSHRVECSLPLCLTFFVDVPIQHLQRLQNNGRAG